MELAQKKALKMMASNPYKTYSLVEIERDTGCDGLAMGDLLYKGYVVPSRGIADWKITPHGIVLVSELWRSKDVSTRS